jgi:uracil-DNA glycosylase
LSDASRRRDILAEIRQAQPEVVILLGDEPIRWFLAYFDDRWKSLADFGREQHSYGQKYLLTLEHESYNVLPLVHPRQAAKLGAHSANWSALHQHWKANQAPELMR